MRDDQVTEERIERDAAQMLGMLEECRVSYLEIATLQSRLPGRSDPSCQKERPTAWPRWPQAGGGVMSNRLLNLAFNCREFRGTARLVLLSIADRINDETGICWSSYDDLQRRCHCSRGALAEALTELRESKVLKPQRRRNRSTLYSLDSELLESLAYPVSSESELHESSESEPAQFGNRTPGSSDSGVSKFGFPNANHPEPPSEPPVNRTTTTAAVSVVDSSVSYKTGNPEEQHQPQNQQPQPRRASPSDPPTETSRLETLRGLRPAKAGEVPSGAILPVDVSVNKTTGKFKIKHEHSSDCSKGCGLRWDPFETVESAVAELEARSAPAKAFAAENDE